MLQEGYVDFEYLLDVVGEVDLFDPYPVKMSFLELQILEDRTDSKGWFCAMWGWSLSILLYGL